MGLMFNTPEAAARIKVSPGWMANQRVTGGGPRFVKLGRNVRYREEDLDEWVSARIRASTVKRAIA